MKIETSSPSYYHPGFSGSINSKNRNCIFDLEILNLFKKINGMDYKTFIENYSTTLD